MNVLHDAYNREINYMRISITDRCNLRCVYCMPAEGVKEFTHQEILRFEEIVSIVKAAAAIGISKYRITGGEPLVRKGLVNFIDEINRIPGVDDISMTTNGILLAEWAER